MKIGVMSFPVPKNIEKYYYILIWTVQNFQFVAILSQEKTCTPKISQQFGSDDQTNPI